ncbi:uncharacterized protein BO97DRAFT_386962 [Aspergillus homomorphus CBS 101889]|uniref:Uncharacterized protein n=1 Tax=Aspergillus homomorphus (strain CBS 101889) TaxID=1450537 RepID=A0A395I3Q9_ASPHC|nr:hypothetical protein BO97DRAFT_386962 [Aspergillus homomorphus CBS 101889]RAL14385.1 hypothetical protein BO97DRAFT_386962 [Aspergillus homomorphus CBS 101889]
MISDLIKPLALFCRQSQFQRYIRRIRNLGDAWRSFTEEPLPESDERATLLETSFGLVFNITNALDEQSGSDTTNVEITTQESPASLMTKEPPSLDPPRHYRIFADWGTDFLWRDPDDLRDEEGDCMLDAEEFLSAYLPSVFEHYDAWVDTYTENFNERRNKTGDFHAFTFATVAEEVAWNVAGYLLAWRIAMAPQVGRIELSVGDSKYLIEKGKETSVTLEFLRDQAEMLAKGERIA